MKRKLAVLAGLSTVAVLAAAAAAGASLLARPETVRVERSLHVQAPPATVLAQLADLRRWASWTPRGSSAALERRYGGPPAGVGASLYWSGEDEAGRLTVVSVSGGAVELELETERPRRSTTDLALVLVPDGASTRVRCEVVAEQRLLERAIAALTRSDGALGRHVEDGLARLKALAEADEKVERYRVERSARIDAAPALVRARVADLRRWASWSPWEEREPQPLRSYGGPGAGAGASYYWSRGGAAGQGRVTILASSADRLELELELPERAGSSSDVEVAVTAEGAGTRVTWVMTGEVDPQAAQPASNPARAIASEVERALARLKSVVEAEPAVRSSRPL